MLAHEVPFRIPLKSSPKICLGVEPMRSRKFFFCPCPIYSVSITLYERKREKERDVERRDCSNGALGVYRRPDDYCISENEW